MKPSLVIVGLGNIGVSYERTRHNIGFQAIDLLSEQWAEGEWAEKSRLKSFVQEARILAVPVLLVKPQTFMNLSGNAVRAIIDFYKLDPAHQLLVMTDDVDLPLGELRLRKKGGPGTHNGLRSLNDHFGEDYARLRIGLGTPQHGEDLAAWVLSVPSPEEQEVLSTAVQKVPQLVRDFVLEGQND